MKKLATVAIAVATLALVTACTTSPSSSASPSASSSAPAPTGPMSFFVTSVGSGKGGDLGGIAGADALCQRLATAAGAGNRTWRAYLSTPPGSNPATPAVHARDRIGKGPWFNAKGVMVARDIAQLHNGNNINNDTALDERGKGVPTRANPPPYEHDMLTGSRADGTAFAPQTDTTCRGWTYSGADGSAIVGHHDRLGPTQDNWSTSWNFSHQTPGCNTEGLARVGGAGRFYCFALN